MGNRESVFGLELFHIQSSINIQYILVKTGNLVQSFGVIDKTELFTKPKHKSTLVKILLIYRLVENYIII